MKKAILILLFPLMCSISFGQNRKDAEKLVNEGITLHDKEDFQGAILKYENALKLDKDNLYALTEIAFSLMSLQKYNEAIEYCQKALETHPGEGDLITVYVNMGTSYNRLKKTDKSIEVYDQGIKEFPNFYRLYYNKGITLAGAKRIDEAILSFQKSITLKPDHGGSHHNIAQLLYFSKKRIPALLAGCRFLVLEPQSIKAKDILSVIQKIMNGNVEKTGEKSVTINFSLDMLRDTTANGKPKENSFTSTELILAMDAALDFDEKNEKKSEVEQFIRKFETVCASLKETKKDNFGFFWNYYVPYFTDMKDKNFIETFAFIIFSSSDDPAVSKWLNANKSKTDKFFEWSKSFEWKSN
ncbi:MAG: tetratricopeptide repeat protein [Bacteroidota bacterium]